MDDRAELHRKRTIQRFRLLNSSFPLRLSVCDPALVTRLPGSAPGTCFAGPHFPWSPPLAPPAPLWLAPPRIAPQQGSPLRSRASQLLWRGPTSRARASSATAPRLPDADRRTRRTSLDNDGQTRDFDTSAAVRLRSPLSRAGPGSISRSLCSPADCAASASPFVAR